MGVFYNVIIERVVDKYSNRKKNVRSIVSRNGKMSRNGPLSTIEKNTNYKRTNYRRNDLRNKDYLSIIY